MSLRYYEFLLQETLTGIRRNAFMSVAAVSTISLSLVLLGAVRLVSDNLSENARALCGRFEMEAFLKPSLPVAARNRAWKEISALPGIKGCRLVTREDAWRILRERTAGSISLEDLQGYEFLPESFVVRVKDLEQMGALADRIARVPGVAEVKDTRELAARLAVIRRGIQTGGMVAVGVLTLVAAVIVGNTIRLTVHARRTEISIMQMVGATNGCVRTPFLLEGAFHGGVGALLALAMLAATYTYLHGAIRRAVPFLEVIPPEVGLFWGYAGLLLGVGVSLGLAGSYLAVRRYLRAVV